MSTITPMCDTHEQDVADALCLNHRRLMCFSCALKEAKCSDCQVIETRTIGKKDLLMLRCLSLKQSVSRKEHQFGKHEMKAAEMKKDLEQKVIGTYEKLIGRITQLKDNCLEKLDQQSNDIRSTSEVQKQSFLNLQTTISEFIDKISIDDTTDIENKVNEIEKEIIEIINEKEPVLEDFFIPNSKLEKSVMQSGIELCNVALIEQKHYAVINDDVDTKRDRTSLYLSSEEILADYVRPETTVLQDQNHECEGKLDRTSSENSAKMSMGEQEEHEPESRGFFAKLFSSNKNKSKSTTSEKNERKPDKKEKMQQNVTSQASTKVLDKPHEESTRVYQKDTEPKQFINRTVQMSAFRKNDFTSSLKFSNLVYLGDGYIAMVSETQNLLALVGLDGHFFGKKTLKAQKIFVCSMDKGEVATLKDPGFQIDKFKVSNEGLIPIGSVVTSEPLSKITGFGFDVNLCNFAVSTPEKVTVLDNCGNVVTVTSYNTTNKDMTNELVTIFHFEEDCLYVLNVLNKTLKMFSLKRKRVVWKSKIDSNDVAPKNMCLYKDKLCVTCGSSIAVFSASSGKPIIKHETSDLLEDCLGLCVIDSVLAFSSGCDDFETSAKLAYISI